MSDVEPCRVCGPVGPDGCRHGPWYVTETGPRPVQRPGELGGPIYAPDRVIENGVVIYAKGDVVPRVVAERLGLADALPPRPTPVTDYEKVVAARAAAQRENATRKVIRTP